MNDIEFFKSLSVEDLQDIWLDHSLGTKKEMPTDKEQLIKELLDDIAQNHIYVPKDDEK